MVFTTPILEVDLYRYMWDGKVANVDVSPFKFSPAQIVDGDARSDDADYEKLVELGDESQSNYEILSRIHFKEYSTIYPPVSQFVFRTSMKLIPETASVEAHVYWMKFVLVLFDVATIFLILFLLLKAKIHLGWIIAYAWNPLVIKEVANSGHLDSIAVFLMVLAICAAVRSFSDRSKEIGVGFSSVVCAAVSLALATGAKIFPVILVPAMALALWQRNWKWALLFVLIYLPVTAAVMWPMARENSELKKLVSRLSSKSTSTVSHGTETTFSLPEPNQFEEPEPANNDGLTSFLKNWRMNDLVFSFIYYNAEPNTESEIDRAWFAFVPNDSRIAWYEWIAEKTEAENPAFLTARIVTVAMFGIAYIFILLRLSRADETRQVLECFFFVLAMFFMLQPTQNPWYWLWSAPLVMFARNRGWLLVSAILFVYYLRFWFTTLPGEYAVGNFQYTGTGLFDYIVVFLEYSVILGAVFWFWLRGRVPVSIDEPKELSV